MTHYSIPKGIEKETWFRLENPVEKEEIQEILDAMKAKRAHLEKENDFFKKVLEERKVAAPQAPPFSKVTVKAQEDFVCDMCGAKVARNHRIIHQNWHQNQKDELMSMAVELVKTLASIPVLEEEE